ncbi:MAG TPA: aminoglycoside 6-adenylyltransferase [Symbiobacteriaceae bacterium]|nr:aminoglycoside 6-adenylyltransferase [Symbiobacteriaceae bacterium]
MRTASEMIARFRAWAEAREDVRAVMLTSSRANPTARVDLFSDYDVVLVLSDPTPLAGNKHWQADFGRVIASFRDQFVLSGHPAYTRLTLYEDGVKVDFSLWPVSLLLSLKESSTPPDYLDIGYMVLLDKDGLTNGLPAPTYRAYIPTPPSQETYEALVREFWWDSTYVAKNLWRDDLYMAKYMLDYFLRFHHVLPLLEWYAEVQHNWSVRPGVKGRGLKRILDTDTWAELEHTYAGAGIEENWAALFAMAGLVRRVARSVAESLGLNYPEQADLDVTAYLEKVRSLPTDAKDFPL